MSTRNQLRALPWACLAAALLTVNTGAAQAPGRDYTFGPAVAPEGGRTIVLKSPSGEVIPFPPWARFFTPPSGLEKRPGYAHTNVEVGIPPKGGFPKVIRPLVTGPPLTGYLIETPASLACVYRLVAVASGCNPNVVTTNASGGSRAIAIVDAFDYTTAASDLAAFDAQFGVTPATFTKIFGTGTPSAGCVNGPKPPDAATEPGGWDVEAALDIEMANAMAPGAHMYLVEANSNSFTDLFNAVAVATKCVQLSGSGEVSMSFGGSEFAGETANDSTFTGTDVAYFASAGDSPGVEYPAASPNVIGVGGTTISRNQTTGAFESEVVWNNSPDEFLYFGDPALPGTGGGPSAFESIPSYQSGVSAIVGTKRGTPDIAGVADIASGVWVFNTPTFGGWNFVGGTSVASPLDAAIVNRSGFVWKNSFAALTNIYSLSGKGKLTTYFTNINGGVCGAGGTAAFPNSFGEGIDPAFSEAAAGINYNMCAGWGTLHGNH
jgi:kumamolisin